jgi:hypothetical protein
MSVSTLPLFVTVPVRSIGKGDYLNQHYVKKKVDDICSCFQAVLTGLNVICACKGRTGSRPTWQQIHVHSQSQYVRHIVSMAQAGVGIFVLVL